MITIFYKLIRNMSLKLPKNTSLQDLYLEDDQTIWFMIWILKQYSPCDRYVSQMILETPFQVIQDTYFANPIQYIRKNGQRCGVARGWLWDGQLWFEKNWKNGQQHGPERVWHQNGQLIQETNWKSGQKHGLARGWYQNGQLWYEKYWENGKMEKK